MLRTNPNSLNNESDEELIIRYRNSHDVSYIGILYKRYLFLVFGICLKYFKNRTYAEDASMEIFEQLIKLLKKHDVKQFKPWLYQVSRNHCLMELRKSKRELSTLDEFLEEDINIVDLDDFLHLDNGWDNEEEGSEKVRRCLESLKTEQRECLTLFFYDKKSYEEIVTMTGFSYNQVKSHIQNGKRNLKLIMEKNEPER